MPVDGRNAGEEREAEARIVGEGAKGADDNPMTRDAHDGRRWAARLLRSADRGAARYIPSRPFRLRNNRPIVSFTFDDVPESAHLEGARCLDRHGVRGTFYVAPGTFGERRPHWRVITREGVRALAGSGHEIGAHTHRHVSVQDLDAAGLDVEINCTDRELRDLTGGRVIENFAYPYGIGTFARKLQLQRRYATCRGIYPGLNCGRIDLAMLAAEELYDRTLSDTRLHALLADAEAQCGWLIFYTHDVSSTPSWIGCSPDRLDAVVTAVRSRGFSCLSVSDAIAASGYTRGSTAESFAT